MELKEKIKEVLNNYGCIRKGGKFWDEVIDDQRNEDLVNDLFALYAVVKPFYCSDEKKNLTKKCNYQCERCMLLDAEV